MAGETQEILARLKVQNGAGFKSEMGGAAGAVTKLGVATEVTGKKTAVARAETFAWGTAARFTRLHLLALGFAAEAVVVETVKMGFEFDEASAKGIAAFTGIEKSASKARATMAGIVRVGNETGLSLPGLTQGETRLLDMGFAARESLQVLDAIGTFAQKRNLGQGGVDSLISILARIRQQGQLTGRTMLGLIGQGVPVISILQKQLGLTAAQAELVRRNKLAVPAGLAIPALTAGLAATPGELGLGAQVGRVRNLLAEITGGAEQGAFSGISAFVGRIGDALQRGVLASAHGGGVGAFLTGVDPSGRLLRDWNALAAGLHGVVAGLQLFFNLGRKIIGILGDLGFGVLTRHTTLLRYAVTALTFAYVASRTAMLGVWAAGKLVAAGDAALAFATDAYLVTLYALDGELVVTGTAFETLGAGMLLATGPAGWITAAALGFFILYERVTLFRNAVNATVSYILGHWKDALVLLGGGMFLGPLFLAAKHVSDIKNDLVNLWTWLRTSVFTLNFGVHVATGLLGELGHLGKSGASSILHLAGAADGANLRTGGPLVVGERGPEIVNLPRGAQVVPLDRGAGGSALDRLASAIMQRPMVTVLEVDGQELARGVAKYTDGVLGPAVLKFVTDSQAG